MRAQSLRRNFSNFGLFISITHPLCLLQAQTPAFASASLTESQPVGNEPVKLPDTSASILSVRCEHDELAIVATGATLRNIFSAVQGCTGIPIVVPEDMKEEKSYLRFGPSPTLTVLEELLDSTELNFVIEPANPTRHRGITVLLLPQASEIKLSDNALIQESGSAQAMTPARRAWMATRVAGRSASEATDDAHAANGVSNASPSSGQELTVAHESESAPVVPNAEITTQNSAAHHAGEGTQEVGSPSLEPIPPPPSSPDLIRAKQIEDMQKLFEDRKRQMSTPTPATSIPE